MTLYAFAIETKEESSRWWNRDPSGAGAGTEESALAIDDFADAVMDRWLEHLAKPSQDYEWMYAEDVYARALVWDVDRVVWEAGPGYLSRPEEFTPRRYVELLAANKIDADAETSPPPATVRLAVVQGLAAWDRTARSQESDMNR